jgi:hypothetical protein
MATFKTIDPSDVRTASSNLNQLVDVIQEDVSGSATRKKFLVYVTGGVGPGITSSLFQSVYDQDFSLQTANAIADFTVGLYFSGSTVLTSSTGESTTGQLLFSSQTLMMREKVDIYKQYAQTLLGNAGGRFYTPYHSTTAADAMDDVLFINIKRLFSRDQVKPETFATRIYATASLDGSKANVGRTAITTITGSKVWTDVGAASNRQTTPAAGLVAPVVNSANTNERAGLLFYDAGILALDMARIFSGSQYCSGVIDAMKAGTLADAVAGETLVGVAGAGNLQAAFIPDFICSASIDNIVDTICSTRFQSGTLTAATFQNVTHINSTLIFCRATADEFNYSSNPTFTDSNNRIVVIDQASDNERSFTFPTAVGLYTAGQNLVAVAKLSRPIEKNDEKDITIRVRLDF